MKKENEVANKLKQLKALVRAGGKAREGRYRAEAYENLLNCWEVWVVEDEYGSVALTEDMEKGDAQFIALAANSRPMLKELAAEMAKTNAKIERQHMLLMRANSFLGAVASGVRWSDKGCGDIDKLCHEISAELNEGEE